MSPKARPRTGYRRILVCEVAGCNGWANKSGKCPGHDGKTGRGGGANARLPAATADARKHDRREFVKRGGLKR